jgi:hydroxymethylpyrimidine/phosphomethylpyrimidine kinase
MQHALHRHLPDPEAEIWLMTNPYSQTSADDGLNPELGDESAMRPACVMTFNASDPCGAAGLCGDALAIASVGAHALPVVTGSYARDTAEIFEHFCLSEEAVAAQARAVLEDMPVHVIKVGFVGSPENLSVIAAMASDYDDVPVVAYMPSLSWWDDAHIDSYLDAFSELLLPQTTVLVGHYSTLWRWLLPDWSAQAKPQPRDIARAAEALGAPYTLVTGIPLPDQWIDNVLASPNEILASEKIERIEAVFVGAGDTLSAALAALLASGSDLASATREALSYLDRCLMGGFRPGMGHMLPDRLFWAQPESLTQDDADLASDDFPQALTEELSHVTKH